MKFSVYFSIHNPLLNSSVHTKVYRMHVWMYQMSAIQPTWVFSNWILKNQHNLSKIFLQTPYFLCHEPACYNSARMIHVWDRIFKLTQFHASVIICFHEFAEFSKSYTEFGKKLKYLGNSLCNTSCLTNHNCEKTFSCKVSTRSRPC